MKKFFTVFFVVLGVIFFALLVALSVFLIRDPSHIRPILWGIIKPSSAQTTATSADAGSNPLLDANQEASLKTMGVDSSALPTTITPEMAACFTVKLGVARTTEIKNGSTVTAGDFLLAKDCLK